MQEKEIKGRDKKEDCELVIVHKKDQNVLF